MCFRKSPSPAITLPQHESTNSNVSEASSTALNLRHLSIDQTKEASLTQMDEIWRQVEAIGDRPSKFTSPLVNPPIAMSTETEDNRNGVLSPSLDPKDTGMEPDTFEDQGRQDSEVLRESDIVISVLEPVDQSTPLRPTPVEGGAISGVSGAEFSGESSLVRPEDQVSRLKNRPTSFSNQG